MTGILQKLAQPSSAAGFSALVYSIPALLVNPADPQAWGATIAAAFAIFRDEAKPIGK